MISGYRSKWYTCFHLIDHSASTTTAPHHQPSSATIKPDTNTDSDPECKSETHNDCKCLLGQATFTALTMWQPVCARQCNCDSEFESEFGIDNGIGIGSASGHRFHYVASLAFFIWLGPVENHGIGSSQFS